MLAAAVQRMRAAPGAAGSSLRAASTSGSAIEAGRPIAVKSRMGGKPLEARAAQQPLIVAVRGPRAPDHRNRPDQKRAMAQGKDDEGDGADDHHQRAPDGA